MAKLTKTEVNAIAGKLHRDLTEKQRLIQLRAMSEYIPSANYLQLQSRCKDLHKLIEQIKELQLQKDADTYAVNRFAEELGLEIKYWNTCKDLGEINKLLNQLVVIETRLPTTIPSIEEIKDDITIAAIDSDFNVEEYLKSQLEKW